MSYTYLQEREAGFWEECYSDTPQFALWKLNHIVEKSYSKDSETEFCQSSQYGMMCEHLTVSHGEEGSMSYAVDSRARILALPEKVQALTEKGLDFGLRCAESLRKFNLELVLLKTPRSCGLADLALCCKTLPRWGMMLDGECLEFATLARIIFEKGCSYTLPTPTCHNAKEGNYPAEHTRRTPSLAAQIGGKVNPDWNEWRMGWPEGWTSIGVSDLKQSVTDKFQQWLRLHGKL